MKRLLIVLLVVPFLACKKAEQAKIELDKARAGETAPAAYVQGLQKDLQKAEAVRDKANAATAEASQTAADLVKAEESGQ